MSQDHSGAIAPPPVIYGAFFAIGLGLDALGLDALWPSALLSTPVQHGVGLALIVAGVVIAVPTVMMFWKHRTSLHVHHPTTAVITAGPYRFSRNPAYVSLTLLYGGAAIAVGSFWALVLVVPAALTLTYGVIVREERYLERKFGDDYRRYKAAVRRWI